MAPDNFNQIPANRSFLPPMEEMQEFVQRIYQNGVVTNNGPLVRELEAELKALLGVKHLLLFSSGTMAMEVGVQALELKGEIITSPFSYVVAASSIVKNNCIPVFADIDPLSWSLDPKKVEEKITDQTVAIYPTHLYGNACDVEALDALAKRHGLKIIYDAAHSFGSLFKGSSLLNYGDWSALSLHAYKLFNMVEGGALITNDDALAEKFYRLRYFGLDNQGSFRDWGTNGKTSEFHAAVGLANLRHYESILQSRKWVAELYDELLNPYGLQRPKRLEGCETNHAYYTVLFNNEAEMFAVIDALQAEGIGSKRYFYPSINKLTLIDNQVSMPISEDIASRVLSLPNYFGLTQEDIERIVNVIGKQIG